MTLERKAMTGKCKVMSTTMLCLFIAMWYHVMPVCAQRVTKTINSGWKFHLGTAPSTFNDDDWCEIHLPHTWNTDAYVHKNYYRGTGWYRRKLSLPSSWKEKQVFLKLDAASKDAAVYVNGKLAGQHVGGYTACTFDITSYLNYNQTNTLDIRVDNARQDVAPISGDFTFFGGIYRDVWLTAVPAQHFNLTNHASDGIFISTPNVSKEQGTIAVRSEIKNDADVQAALRLVCSIYAPDGALVQRRTDEVCLDGKSTLKVLQTSDVIQSPQLWTPETPYLYTVRMELKDARTNEVKDCSEHHAAFRWVDFDAKKGFFLNGKPYKLRGICRHQDQKPLGVALTDEMHRRDFRLMKDMGANFIRISHYPQDDALLEMCDKEGMLVWEEIPIIDIVPDTPGYAEHCEQNLREMIRQHYNHPSIILWGYMNEILLVTQRRYQTEETFAPVLDRTLALANRLEQVLKEEDSSRQSVMAFHGSNIYNERGLSDVTDVVGWNLYSGWYGGDLKGFDRFLEEQQRSWPNHPLLVSEYGAGSDRRLHSLKPRPFDFSIEYQQIYLEHYLPVLEHTPYVCGGTHWNFIDFASALRDESMPRINNKGLVYADRTPKDVYYYYQAAWRQDIPVLHIASRDWCYRSGATADNRPVVQPVKVYTNLPEVELFIDGRSLGRQKVENFHAVFQVPFTEGTPYLSARGNYQGRIVNDGLHIRFTPVPMNWTDEVNSRTWELAVNVGSQCFYTSDESQLTWVPDQPYVKGSWGYVGGKEQNTQAEIVQTADVPLYQSMREGLEAYRFDVPSGNFEVELLFTDIYRSTETAAYLLGKGNRDSPELLSRFEISINHQVVESACAPAEEAGYHRAVRKRYLIRTEKDGLNICFRSLQGKCFLSGIKLRKL